MEICDKYLRDYLKINVRLSSFFVDKYKYNQSIQPNVYSDDHFKKILQVNKKYSKLLSEKKKKTPLSYFDNILYRDLTYEKHFDENYKIYMYLPIDLYENILVNYVGEYQKNNFTTKKHYESFMSRIKMLTPITQDILYQFKRGMKQKVTLNKDVVERMIGIYKDHLQNRNCNKRTSSNIPVNYEKLVQLHIYDNLYLLTTFLEDVYSKHSSLSLGLSQYKGGKEYYKNIIRFKTFDDYTPEKVHALGLRELKVLLREKKRLQTSMKVKDIDDYVYNNVPLSNDVIKDMETYRDVTYEKIYKKYFYNKLLKKDLYKVIPFKGFGYAYYSLRNSGSHKRVGYVSMNVEESKKSSKDELLALSIHEGVPGHHLERYTSWNNKSLPDYMKMSSETMYIEGWAFYCEGLYDYKDDVKYYGKLQYDVLRTLRLIVDTGIHYYGWNYEKSYKYMKKYMKNMSEESLRDEILRYSCNPGQAVCYKLGGMIFEKLKNYSLQRGMTIQDFHEKVLSIGPAPMESFIREFMNQCGSKG